MRIAYAVHGSGPPREPTGDDIELDVAFEALIRVGWGRPGSEFRRVFTSMMIPGATEEQGVWLDELQRLALEAETALVSRRERNLADASALLPQITMPTLVIHALGDQMNDFGQARCSAWTESTCWSPRRA